MSGILAYIVIMALTITITWLVEQVLLLRRQVRYLAAREQINLDAIE